MTTAAFITGYLGKTAVRTDYWNNELPDSGSWKQEGYDPYIDPVYNQVSDYNFEEKPWDYNPLWSDFPPEPPVGLNPGPNQRVNTDNYPLVSVTPPLTEEDRLEWPEHLRGRDPVPAGLRADPLNQGYVESRGDIDQRGKIPTPVVETAEELAAKEKARLKSYGGEQGPPSWLSRWSAPDFEWGAKGQVTDAGVGAGIGSITSALVDFARDKPVSVRRMILMAILGGAGGALFNAIGGWEGIKSTFPSSHPSVA